MAARVESLTPSSEQLSISIQLSATVQVLAFSAHKKVTFCSRSVKILIV